MIQIESTLIDQREFLNRLLVDRPDPQDTEQGVVTNVHLPLGLLFVTSLDDPGT